MKRTQIMILSCVVEALLTLGAGAEVTAVSDDAALDTRGLSALRTVEDEALDTRTYSEDWSEERTLNTQKIIGTMILVS